MSFHIKKVSKEEWVFMSPSAHKISFGERRDPVMDRIDFALIAIDDKGEVSGYVTCIEMDKETVYWQHGGAMPEYKGSIRVLEGYTLFANWCREEYGRIQTRIENGNVGMLKLAMKIGFRICGLHCFKDKIFIELNNELRRAI